jgi:hypothetical protein
VRLALPDWQVDGLAFCGRKNYWNSQGQIAASDNRLQFSDK